MRFLAWGIDLSCRLELWACVWLGYLLEPSGGFATSDLGRKLGLQACVAIWSCELAFLAGVVGSSGWLEPKVGGGSGERTGRTLQ